MATQLTLFDIEVVQYHVRLIVDGGLTADVVQPSWELAVAYRRDVMQRTENVVWECTPEESLTCRHPMLGLAEGGRVYELVIYSETIFVKDGHPL